MSVSDEGITPTALQKLSTVYCSPPFCPLTVPATVVVVLRVCRSGAGMPMRNARIHARIHARNPRNAEQSRIVGLH
jgi:hypothetical protein